jgi:predicted patatin/cPLA2 family phospholipase
MPEQTTHPVIAEITRRNRGESPQLSLALAIEGGSMRGVVSAGMVAAMESIGIAPEVFDAIYSSSAGSYNAAYYLSGNCRQGSSIYWENNGPFIDRRRLLRKLPLVDLDYVLDEVMVVSKPLDFERVVKSKRLYPLATDVATARRHIFEPAQSKEELRLQLRAGSTMPGLAGPPTPVGDRLYYDAALTEPVPLDAAIEHNYEAVFVLVTRSLESGLAPISFRNAVLDKISRNRLRKLDPNLANNSLRPADKVRKNRLLIEMLEVAGREPPYVYTVAPQEGSPTVDRIEKNSLKLIAAAQSGFIAMKQVFGAECTYRFKSDSWLEDY